MTSSVDAKLLRQTKFPPEFSKKVDMTKVNIEVMKKWIAGKISRILGSEDDVVIELCFNLLEGERFPDIKRLQIQLTGFLDRDTAKFCKDLWNLCISAQESPQGVPKELLEAKKQELMQEKMDAERTSSDARNRKDHDRQKERYLNDSRRPKRTERDRRAHGRHDAPKAHHVKRNTDNDVGSRRNRAQDRSFSPTPRETDTYVPNDRQRRAHLERRQRSRSESPYRHEDDGAVRPTRGRGPTRPRSPASRSPPSRYRNKRRESSASTTSRSRSSLRRNRHGRSESPRHRRGRISSSDESAPRKRRKSNSVSPRRTHASVKE